MSGWFVVHTQPAAEQRAAANLARQGYSAYLPLYRRRVSHARRVAFVLRPLFPRYIFVNLDLARDRWRPILSTFGVSGLVRIGETPQAVPAGIVEELRAQEQACRFDETQAPARRLGVGAAVRILAGPFADLVGKFYALADAERVVVLLDLLGREVKVHVSDRAVAVA